jgi:hypothetical protein
MLVVSMPAPAGLQPVELGDVIVCGLDGWVLDVSHGGTIGWLSSCCRTEACVSVVPDCAIDGVHGLLASGVSQLQHRLSLMFLNG